VTLTIRVTRAARGLSLRGLTVRIIVTDEGEGIDPIHLPCQTGRFHRAESHRSREQGRRGWDWPS
jgi:two-component system phosphate regulon sensor histidine kinase PhoR